MATFEGDDTNNNLNGTANDDTFNARRGADTLTGLGGDDTFNMSRGTANDVLDNTPVDTIFGGDGTDTVNLLGVDFTFEDFNFGQSNGNVIMRGETDRAVGFNANLSEVEIVDLGATRILFVDPTNTNGGFTTIQAAVDAAQAGDTILISNGTYTEQVVIDDSGANLNRLTITSFDDAVSNDVTVRLPSAGQSAANGQTLGGRDLHSIFLVDNVDSVTISSIRVNGQNQGTGGDLAGISFINAFRGTVDDVLFENFQYVNENGPNGNGKALYAASVNDDIITITDNGFNNFSKSAIFLDGVNATVEGNVILGDVGAAVPQNGIEAFDSSGTFEDNTILNLNSDPSQNGGLLATGISVSGGSDIEIVDNVIRAGSPDSGDGGLLGIQVLGSVNNNLSGVKIENNIVDGNRNPNAPGASGQSVGILVGDAENVSVADNTLTDLTEAIDVLGFNDIDPPVSIDNNTVLRSSAGLTFQPDPTDQPSVGFDVTGTNGVDSLSGTIASDTLNGFSGDDIILGRRADDQLFGGNGLDSIDGGSGDDLINGNANADDLFGNSGFDTINGGDGADLIEGGAGNDNLFGGDGADVIVGGANNDLINGGNGADDLVGGQGQDIIVGGNGADLLDGGASVDTLNGDNGDDTLFGAGGNDILFGGNGDDVIEGEANNDLIDGGTGNDLLFGGSGADVIFGDVGNDSIEGQAGNDFLDGGNGVDFITGGNNNDTILGGNSADVLAGDDGRDSILGGGGGDDLFGGAGNDFLVGEIGIDFLSGDAGNDTLIGGLSRDTLVGGAGSDDFVYTAAADSRPTGAGRDTILDFARGADKVVIDIAGQHTATSSVTAAGDSLLNVDLNSDGDVDLSVILRDVTFNVNTDLEFG